MALKPRFSKKLDQIGDETSDILNTSLTGFVVGSNTAITSSDTILSAFGKTQGQINALSTGLGDYVKRDGTTALTANWAAGSFRISSSSIGVNTGTSSLASIFHVVNTTTSTIRGIINDQYSASTDSAKIYNRKARGTFASPTVITTGDVLGNWTSSGYDGTSFVDSADMRVVSTGTIATGIIPSQIMFRTMNSTGTLTQALNIDENQNISIGAITPAAIFDVSKNMSAAAWTTNGIGLRWRTATYTDTTSSGTVAAAFVHIFASPTIAASSATTYTTLYTLNLEPPIAGTNVTLTSGRVLRVNGISQFNGIINVSANIEFAGATRSIGLTDSNQLNLITNNTTRFVLANSGGWAGFGTATPTAVIQSTYTALTQNAWTTNGVGFRFNAITFTDSTSSGTVAAQYVHTILTPTIATSSVTTFTLSATQFIAGPNAGTNVTQTNPAALVLGGDMFFQKGSSTVLGTFDSQTLTIKTANTTRMMFGSTGGITFSTGLTYADGMIVTSGTTTGTKFGATTNDKMAFWNKTPIIQPTTGITGATRVGGGGTTITDTDTFGGYTIAKLAAIIINTGLAA